MEMDGVLLRKCQSMKFEAPWHFMALHGFMFCHVFMNVFLYFLSGVEEMSGLGIEVALCPGEKLRSIL